MLTSNQANDATSDGLTAVELRVSARLAADEPCAREDIEFLLDELHRLRTEIETQRADFHRVGEWQQACKAWLNLLQESASAGVWQWFPETGAVIVTPQQEILHGVKPGALQSYEDWRRLIHPDDIARVEAEREAAIARHQIFQTEFRVNLGDGEVRWIASSGQAVYDSQGNVERVIGINRDITECKRTEAMLHDQLAEITFYYDNAPIGMAVLDTNLRFLRINQRLAEINGIPAIEHIGKTVEEIVPDLAAQGRAIADTILATGAPLTDIELSGETSAQPGVIRFWNEVWYPIKRTDGTIIAFSIIAQETTEARQALEKLRQSERNLARAQEIGNIGNWEWDVPNQTLVWSDQLYRLFGVPHDFPLTYEAIEGMIHPDDRTLNQTQVQKALTSADTINYEFRIIRPDGAVRTIAQNIVVEHTASGDPDKLFGVMLDITERKQLLTQLLQAQNMEVIGQLAGGIAHHFNNLLAVILMRTEMSLSLATPATPLHRNLMTIYETTQRSAELVRQLLGFARKQVVTPQVLSLDTAIETMLPALQRLTGAQIELCWLPGSSAWLVEIDHRQVEQVLMNLCANACDAIDGAGTITISITNLTIGAFAHNKSLTPGDYVVLTVTDTGTGMDQITLSHIFDPFFTTKGVGKGVGLGLPMVHGIVDQNKGVIEVFSQPGRGTTFTIYLPRYEDKTTVSSSDRSSMLQRGDNETVLLLEPDPMMQQITVEALEYLGYAAVSVATPDEALAWSAQHPGLLDLLITSLFIIGMDGALLADQLAIEQPGLKSIFLYDALEAGAIEGAAEGRVVLQKPYSLQSLADALRSAFGELPSA